MPRGIAHQPTHIKGRFRSRPAALSPPIDKLFGLGYGNRQGQRYLASAWNSGLRLRNGCWYCRGPFFRMLWDGGHHGFRRLLEAVKWAIYGRPTIPRRIVPRRVGEYHRTYRRWPRYRGCADRYRLMDGNVYNEDTFHRDTNLFATNCFPSWSYRRSQLCFFAGDYRSAIM